MRWHIFISEVEYQIKVSINEIGINLYGLYACYLLLALNKHLTIGIHQKVEDSRYRYFVNS